MIKNPETMFVIEQKTAIAPRTVPRRLWCSAEPATAMAPTMLMALIALVSDINGV